MRLLLAFPAAVVAASVLCLGGCSSENTSAPPPAPVDWHAFDLPHGPVAAPVGPTPRERAAADSYAAAIGSPDMAPLGAMLDADVHFAFPGLPDARGKPAVLRAHQALFGAFDKQALAITRVWRTDGELTLAWTMSGLQSREWMGVAPTNRPVSFRGVTLLFTKDDGTLTDIHVYFDAAVVRTQLGAGPRELAMAGLVPPPAPSGPPQVFDQAHSPEETRNVATARSTLDALEKNDEAAYLAAMTDDVVIETLERPLPMRGKEDARALFRQMHKSIGQLDTTLDNAWGVGSFAIVEYFISGEQIGPVGWVPPQRDRAMRIEVVDVMELRDGKVDHVWRYGNPGQILAGAR
ncbi:MAG: nuclear transport factor 2 family protein [Polyangiaceae bacterium]